MANQIYEISLSSLSISGTACKNIEVIWEKPNCANIKCDFDGKKIKVTIPEGCEGECVYAVVKCKDNTCSDCPDSERIKICPCTVNADCEDCEKCINNMCVSQCVGEQYCDDGRCVDCDPDNPCSGGQVCVSGQCKCPPDKPLKNDKGECVSCLSDGDCPPCTICTPDGCKPIVCPDGACDPSTGDCVECLNTGHCDGPNECCVGKTCECCPGFVRDLTTGECIPAPDCTLDSDCDDCEICVDGICQPIECPEGFICVEGDCKEICDCGDATCSKTAACVTLDPSNCYCEECVGNCSGNADCGEGCYCKDGKCTPKPCKGSCENGGDCGTGCGCQDGECIPCDSLSCANADCASVLGCGCTGAGCRDIGGCSGGCSSSNDCGPDCTCYKGECVPCGDFACDSCDEHPGCACVNGKCEGDDEDCADVFELIKIDDSCDLRADLTAEETCSCPKLTFNTLVKKVTFVGDTYFVDLDVELRKGAGESLAQSKTLSKLLDTSKPDIADNESPISGTVKVLVQPFYDEYDEDGRKIATNVPGSIVETSISVNLKDTASFIGLQFKAPGTAEGDFLKVTKVVAKVQQSTNLVFPNNCTYDSVVEIDSFTVNKTTALDLDKVIAGNNVFKNVFEDFQVIDSDDVRNPLYTWYRSVDGTYSADEIIRKVYIPAISGKYSDTLFGPKDSPKGKYPLIPEEGGLRSGKYFAVKNDCSCDQDADLGKLIFCNPSELIYEAKECNTVVEIKTPFEPCSVNQDLAKFGVNDPSSQVKYDLYLNGTKVATFRDSQYGMIQDGTTNSMFDDYDLGGEPITSIDLKINHDDSEQCTLSYSLEEVSARELVTEILCGISGPDYVIYIDQAGENYFINGVADIIVDAGATRVKEGNKFKIIAKKGVDTTVKVTFNDACTKTEIFNEDCCEEFTASFTRLSAPQSTTLDLQLTIAGGTSPFKITYTTPEGIKYRHPDPTLPAPTGNPPVAEAIVAATKADATGLTLPQYQAGTYLVSIEDTNGCIAEASIIIDKIEPPVVTFSGYRNICQNDSTSILITAPPAYGGGTVNYTENGVSKSKILSAGGTATIENIQITSTFVFISLVKDGYTYSIGQTVQITKYSSITAALSATTHTICQGQSLTINVTGTPGAVVTVLGVSTPITLNSGGTGSFVVSPNSNAVYQVTNITYQGCTSNGGSTWNVTVNPAIDIVLISQECNSGLTTRTLVFNNITTAVNQSGVALTVTSNSVTVNPNTVTSVTVTYSGDCVVTETYAVSPCTCPNTDITIIDNGLICEGETMFITPIQFAVYGDPLNNKVVVRRNGVIIIEELEVPGDGYVYSITGLVDPPQSLTVQITNMELPGCTSNVYDLVPTVIVIDPPSIVQSPFGTVFTDQNYNFSLVGGSAGLLFDEADWTTNGPSGLSVYNGQSNITANFSSTGTHYVTALVPHTSGCEVQVYADFTVEPNIGGFVFIFGASTTTSLTVNLTRSLLGPYTVNWGDSTTSTHSSGSNATHFYSSPYTGDVEIYYGTEPLDMTNFVIDKFNDSLDIFPEGTTYLTIFGTKTGDIESFPSTLEELRLIGSGSVDGAGTYGGDVAQLPAGLTYFRVLDSNSITGDVADLPVGLVHMLVNGDNTLSGDVADLPVGLEEFTATGSNTIAGDTVDLPAGLIEFTLQGDNTLSGDVADLPVGLERILLSGDNTVFGDIADMPTSLESIIISGDNIITGDLINVHTGLNNLNITGLNTLFGSPSNLPNTLQSVSIFGSNVVSGDIFDIPSGITTFNIASQAPGVDAPENIVTGDIADIPNSTTSYTFTGGYASSVTYTGKTWSGTMSRLIFTPNGGAASKLSSVDLDQLLIDLAAATWSGSSFKPLTINVNGSHPRTAASNAAKATLITKGVTVSVPE